MIAYEGVLLHGSEELVTVIQRARIGSLIQIAMSALAEL